MSTFTEPTAASDILLRLDRAHKASHKELDMLNEAQDKAMDELWLKHAPFITEAKSVFLQVQAEAYRAGFTDEDMAKVIGEACA